MSAAEQEENNMTGFKDFGLQNGSSQGQNRALTVLCVPNSLESGWVSNQYPFWWQGHGTRTYPVDIDREGPLRKSAP